MVLRNSFYNLLGLGLPLTVAVVSIPMLVHSLGEERFGILTLIWAVVSYFGLFDLGLGRAVTQQVAIAIADERHDRLDTIVGTSSAMMLVLGLFGALVMLAIAPAMARQLASGSQVGEVERAFFWMAAAMPAIVLTSGYRGILEATGKFALINTIRLPMGIFTFAGPLLAVWAGHVELDAIAAVLTLGRIIACIVHGWFALRTLEDVNRHGRYEAAMVGPLLRFGGWLSIMNIFGPLIGYADRFIVGVVLGPKAATYFVTPQEVASKVSLIPMAISAVLFPDFASSRTNDRGQTFRRIGKYTFINGALTAIPSLFIAIFSYRIMQLWIGSDFAERTYLYLSIFALGCFINSLAHIPLTYIVAKNGSRYMSMLYFLEAIAYAAAIYIFGMWFGLLAAVYVWLARIIVDTIAVAAMCVFLVRKDAVNV